MIICHTHKFIFAKNKKVGSSSTEIFLRDFLDSKVDVWYGECGFGSEENYDGYNIGGRKDPHISLHDVITEQTQNYHKCIVERDPWDQYLSMIDYQTAQGHTHYSPKKFFDFNYNIYIDFTTNVPLVDKIMRYENLTEELKQFCKRFQLPFNESRWKKMTYKSSTRKNKTKEFYEKNPNIKNQVENAAWFHIKHLGYKFTEKDS